MGDPEMRSLTLSTLLLLASCASCQLVEDASEAPAVLSQDRAMIKIGDDVDAIQGVVGSETMAYVRAYGESTVTVSGLKECGYITSGSSKKSGWVPIPLSHFPDKEFCIYSVLVRGVGFDAPATGHLLIRKFTDPNVVPLTVEMNHVVRKGVNWVQLRSDSEPTFFASNTTLPVFGGISEGRDVVIHLGGHSGKLNITGCGFQPDVIEYENMQEMYLTVDQLYREAGKVDRSCVFTVTANHDDALKESASLFVKVYNGTGSFLDAPMVDVSSNQACFQFIDPYVVGIEVNDKKSYSDKVCVAHAKSYVVEGVTSKFRTFYGIYDESLGWETMK
jgi:hypothetical protein